MHVPDRGLDVLDRLRAGAGQPELVVDQALLASGRSVEEARDELWALGAVGVYELLVGQRGWSPDRYRDWLVDVWADRLLADPG